MKAGQIVPLFLHVIQPGTADFDKYAAIYWKPDLITDSTSSASFNFFVPEEIKSLNLRVEGISLEGKIYLHEQKIAVLGR